MQSLTSGIFNSVNKEVIKIYCYDKGGAENAGGQRQRTIIVGVAFHGVPSATMLSSIQ